MTVTTGTARRRLDDREVLDVWGRVAPHTGAGRLAALAAAATDEDVAGWPIGRATAVLLQLHGGLAGPTLAATVDCPACGEQVEFELAIEELASEELAAEGTRPVAPVAPVEHDGWHVTWSPPTVGQYGQAADASTPERARVALLAATIEQVKAPDGTQATAAELPPAVETALAAAVAAADPLVELVVELRCAACDEPVRADVDVAAHITAALEARTTRVLDEVHELARGYGWREDEVLALPRWRRVAYLDRVRTGIP